MLQTTLEKYITTTYESLAIVEHLCPSSASSSDFSPGDQKALFTEKSAHFGHHMESSTIAVGID